MALNNFFVVENRWTLMRFLDSTNILKSKEKFRYIALSNLSHSITVLLDLWSVRASSHNCEKVHPASFKCPGFSSCSSGPTEERSNATRECAVLWTISRACQYSNHLRKRCSWYSGYGSAELVISNLTDLHNKAFKFSTDLVRFKRDLT